MRKFRFLFNIISLGRFFIFYLISFNIQLSFSMVGGSILIQNYYPGQVKLYVVESGLGLFYSVHYCSGLLLEKRRVLITTKCLTGSRIDPGPGQYQSVTFPIPAANIHVYPLTDSPIRISRNRILPDDTPYVGVISYVKDNSLDLAILYLDTDLNLPFASFYNGSSDFTGIYGTATGWETTLDGYMDRREFELKKLVFPVVNASNHANDPCSVTSNAQHFFCGGFRNSTHYLNRLNDEGAGYYMYVNGINTVIGITHKASARQMQNGQFVYEKYVRSNAAASFILQHAAETKFWNETSTRPFNPIPLYQLLLLE